MDISILGKLCRSISLACVFSISTTTPTTAQEDFKIIFIPGSTVYAISDLREGIAYYQKRDYASAFNCLERQVPSDSTAAQIVGTMYFYGQGLKKNVPKGLQLLSSAAAAGNASACSQLGLIYFYGNNVPKDYKKAFAYLRIDNQTPAGLQLRARMLEEGLGCTANLAEALSCYSKAALRGSIDAKATVGEFNYLGKGTSKNARLARSYFEEAARKNSPKAQLYLAEMYVKGEEVPQDPAKAKQLLAQAQKTIDSRIKAQSKQPPSYKGETDSLAALATRVKTLVNNPPQAAQATEQAASKEQQESTEEAAPKEQKESAAQ